MQDPQSNASRRTQGALQLLISRAQPRISSATSTEYFPGTLVRDFEQIARRGLPLTPKELPAFVDAIEHLHGTIDDRKFLLEDILMLMARLPDDSQFAKGLQQYLISLLYKDLPHPPTGFLSTFRTVSSTAVQERSASYAFRSADGSNYNVLVPSLGQAGQPYARTVPSTHIQTLASLPDPGIVFERLLRRRNDDFAPHPGGISSLFFSFANLIIHSIFNTNPSDWTINDASSYLDLSIVYGSNKEQVESLRKKDGTGKIWEDAFADSRLLSMPPSVCALTVLFSRHHNFIAQKILDINERGSFAWPPPGERTALLAQDDEIFDRARLVNTAFFMQIILADYVGAILGLERDALPWRLDPLSPYREIDHEVSPRGEGNVVSVEFNLLYRWHAAISKHDEKWLNQTFETLFDNKDPETVTIEEFRKVVREKVVPSGPVETWTFGGLQRGPDGRFSDQDLARILQDATEDRAGAFRARGCPPVMRLVEILSIQQGRKWGVCTLNEFRQIMGLRPYTSFKEWNPDPAIYSAAEELYGHVDNLELHVGMQAEETKPLIPGAGLCPGFTISRAILADAVCLTRGDRFLTVDYTPYNLTSWGYQHCMRNTDDGSYGGMLSRLLLQLLPDQYPAASIYAHFPFMTPDFMRPRIAAQTANVSYYNFERPGDNGRQLNKVYKKRVVRLTKGVEAAPIEMQKIIVEETSPVASITKMFNILVEKASISASPNNKVVDIVKDVINQLPIYWAANFVLGLPITTFDSVLGGHSVSQWCDLFADVTRYVYFNDDPVHDWNQYQTALKAANEILFYITDRVNRRNGAVCTVLLGAASDMLRSLFVKSNVQNGRVLSRVLASAKQASTESIAYDMFTETVPSALLFSAAIASVIDYYADPSRKDELQNLIQLSTAAPGDSADQALMRLIVHALTRGQDVQNEPWPPVLIVIGNHHIDIREQGCLMSQDVFTKLAPRVVAAIFSLKHVSFPDAPTEIAGGLPVSRIIQYDM